MLLLNLYVLLLVHGASWQAQSSFQQVCWLGCQLLLLQDHQLLPAQPVVPAEVAVVAAAAACFSAEQAPWLEQQQQPPPLQLPYWLLQSLMWGH